MSVSGPPSVLRVLNERAVLEVVADHGPLARADVAARLSLSKPTVAAALTRLVERGTVVEKGQVAGRKVPAAVLYGLAADAFLAMGIDIGARWIRVALRDAWGVTRGAAHEPTPTDAAEVPLMVARLAVRVASDAGHRLDDVTAVVAALPGVVRADGRTLHLADGLPGGGAGLGEALAREFGEDIVLENDLNLGALAEHSVGAAVGVDDFVLIGLGTGVGMGVMLGGQLYRGGRGLIGEVGYLPGPSGDPGERERVDDILGSQRLVQLAARAGHGEVTAQDVFALARSGKEDALAMVDDAARGLAWVISCVVPALDPSLVVLGGSIGSNGDLLAEPVRAHLAEFSPMAPDIAFSTLGSQATLVGAVERADALARERAFTLATAAD